MADTVYLPIHFSPRQTTLGGNVYASQYNKGTADTDDLEWTFVQGVNSELHGWVKAPPSIATTTPAPAIWFPFEARTATSGDIDWLVKTKYGDSTNVALTAEATSTATIAGTVDTLTNETIALTNGGAPTANQIIKVVLSRVGADDTMLDDALVPVGQIYFRIDRSD